MTATAAIHPDHDQPATGASAPRLVPATGSDAAEAEAEAEHGVFRDAAIGAAIGVVVFAPLYAALVWLALRSHGTPMAAPLLMAAGVGVLAGVFLGGWSGTLVGATALEKFEREHRTKA
jgi:hypothetical protein